MLCAVVWCALVWCTVVWCMCCDSTWCMCCDVVYVLCCGVCVVMYVLCCVMVYVVCMVWYMVALSCACSLTPLLYRFGRKPWLPDSACAHRLPINCIQVHIESEAVGSFIPWGFVGCINQNVICLYLAKDQKLFYGKEKMKMFTWFGNYVRLRIQKNDLFGSL